MGNNVPFVAAENKRKLSLTRLQMQFTHLANLLHPVLSAASCLKHNQAEVLAIVRPRTSPTQYRPSDCLLRTSYKDRQRHRSCRHEISLPRNSQAVRVKQVKPYMETDLLQKLSCLLGLYLETLFAALTLVCLQIVPVGITPFAQLSDSFQA